MIVAAFLAAAIALSGHVVAVHDGDTLTLFNDRQQVKVRLVEIDAPELGQPKDSPLYRLQNRAKADHSGLWSDPTSIPPWEWRAKKKAISK